MPPRCVRELCVLCVCVSVRIAVACPTRCTRRPSVGYVSKKNGEYTLLVYFFYAIFTRNPSESFCFAWSISPFSLHRIRPCIFIIFGDTKKLYLKHLKFIFSEYFSILCSLDSFWLEKFKDLVISLEINKSSLETKSVPQKVFKNHLIFHSKHIHIIITRTIS